MTGSDIARAISSLAKANDSVLQAYTLAVRGG
jgi:hypothetical protein